MIGPARGRQLPVAGLAVPAAELGRGVLHVRRHHPHHQGPRVRRTLLQRQVTWEYFRHFLSKNNFCLVSVKINEKYFNRENIFCSQYSNILTCVFRYRDTDWFVRVGDNYMASRDPSEQTFQVHMNRPPNLLISPSSSTQLLIQSCHQS